MTKRHQIIRWVGRLSLFVAVASGALVFWMVWRLT